MNCEFNKTSYIRTQILRVSPPLAPLLHLLRVWVRRSFSTVNIMIARRGGHVCLMARPCISAGQKPVYAYLLGRTCRPTGCRRNGRHLSCWGLVLICPLLLLFWSSFLFSCWTVRHWSPACSHARHCMACPPARPLLCMMTPWRASPSWLRARAKTAWSLSIATRLKFEPR